MEKIIRMPPLVYLVAINPQPIDKDMGEIIRFHQAQCHCCGKVTLRGWKYIVLNLSAN